MVVKRRKKKKKKVKQGPRRVSGLVEIVKRKKNKNKNKNQGPRYVSGPGGGDASVQGGVSRRVLTHLEPLLLVEEGGREGEGLEPPFAR